jgi:hypothetical protein
MPRPIVYAYSLEVFHNLIGSKHGIVGCKVMLFEFLICFLGIIRTFVLAYDGLPFAVSTLASSTAYQNFCFSQKRSYAAVVRGTYLGLRTSLRSCAHAILVNVLCHWSLFLSSFKVGKALKSRFIPRLNKSTRD